MAISTILTEYWGVTVFVLGMIFHALFMYFKIGNHEKRIEEIERKDDTTNRMVAEIKEHIASMNAKLEILLNNMEITKRKQ